MVRDGVANIVSRLREFGFDPRKVGQDVWESRCPAHRSLDHALSITRNEFNHVVLACRGIENCQHTAIVRALGFTNDHLYAETPDWLISQLRRVEIQPSCFALTHNVRDSNGPSCVAGERVNESAEVSLPFEEKPNSPAIDRCAKGPQPASEGVSVTAVLLSEERPETTWEHPEIANDANEAATSQGHETSQAVALVSEATAVQTVKELPTDALMRMAGVERVILGSDGRSYASVTVNGQAECRELKSKALRNLLTHAALKATGKLPTPEAIAAVVGVLEANAEFDGAHEDVFLRVARGPSGSSYFLDLADREGRIIEIRADGWEEVTAPPVFFRRAAGQLALPVPARGGSLELLKKYVNVEAADWPLFIGWLTAAMRPVGPHPILVLTGEQGAAKTTMLRVCRRLIDPNASPVRSQPKELRDLMIAARKSWLMAYDNITALPGWLSNGLCGLATGTGFTIRSLGTDDEEVIFVAQRPIIINGINDFVDRADLGDRSYFLHLPRISWSMRRTEEAFWADFDRNFPLILGGLLDAVSAGMRALPEVHLPGLSRLADAERWAEAVARGLGWAPGTFSDTLGANRVAANELTLEESPVAVTVIDLAVRCPFFRGTMQELLKVLNVFWQAGTFRSSDLPKTARALSVKLRQLAPQLRSIGIEVEFQRETTHRFVTIAMTEENGASGTHHKSPLVGARLKAYIEIKNRNARSSDQSRNSARPTQRDERVTQTLNP
jgi:hypothetical protein